MLSPAWRLGAVPEPEAAPRELSWELWILFRGLAVTGGEHALSTPCKPRTGTDAPGSRPGSAGGNWCRSCVLRKPTVAHGPVGILHSLY